MSIFKDCCYLFQNYLNESLKYLDKLSPNSSSSLVSSGGVAATSVASGSSASSAMNSIDTKPIYIDTKALLGHHMPNQEKKWEDEHHLISLNDWINICFWPVLTESVCELIFFWKKEIMMI